MPDKQQVNQRPPGPAQQEERPARLEWLLGAAGLVLLLSSIGYLAYQAISGASRPPAPVLSVIAVDPQQGKFLVRVQVTNQGSTTAAALKITGSLTRDGAVVEQAEAVLDYLPAGSAREGGLFFSRDPRQYELELSAAGYQKP